MAIVFSCPCGNQLQVADEQVGKQVRCPKCGTVLLVPAEGGVTARPPAAPAAATRIEAAPQPRRDRSGDRDEDRGRRDNYDREPARAAQTSGKAIFALILGIGSFFCTFFLGLPAIIFGLWSIRDVKRSGGRLSGSGMAVTGIILGSIGTIVSCVVGGLIGTGVFGLFAGIEKVRTAAARSVSQNNLRQIGIAMNNYEITYGHLPAGAIYSPDGSKPLLSWRVAILPYVEQGPLYNEFHLNEAWDSPHNMSLLAKMPKLYEAPGKDPGTDQTYYRVFHMKQEPKAKPGGGFDDMPVFVTDRTVTLAQLSNQRGTSNIILVVDAAESVPWTKPEELPFPVDGPIEPLLGGIFKYTYQVLLADGHVSSFNKDGGNEKVLKAAITQNSTDAVLLP